LQTIQHDIMMVDFGALKPGQGTGALTAEFDLRKLNALEKQYARGTRLPTSEFAEMLYQAKTADTSSKEEFFKNLSTEVLSQSNFLTINGYCLTNRYEIAVRLLKPGKKAKKGKFLENSFPVFLRERNEASCPIADAE
jgi:hypothetical protein